MSKYPFPVNWFWRSPSFCSSVRRFSLLSLVLSVNQKAVMLYFRNKGLPTCTNDGLGHHVSPTDIHLPPIAPALPGSWAGSSSLQYWGLHSDAEWGWWGGSTELQKAHSSPQGSVGSESLPWGACRECREPYLWHFHRIAALWSHWDLQWINSSNNILITLGGSG